MVSANFLKVSPKLCLNSPATIDHDIIIRIRWRSEEIQPKYWLASFLVFGHCSFKDLHLFISIKCMGTESVSSSMSSPIVFTVNLYKNSFISMRSFQRIPIHQRRIPKCQCVILYPEESFVLILSLGNIIYFMENPSLYGWIMRCQYGVYTTVLLLTNVCLGALTCTPTCFQVNMFNMDNFHDFFVRLSCIWRPYL